jgi:hypothetical protein
VPTCRSRGLNYQGSRREPRDLRIEPEAVADIIEEAAATNTKASAQNVVNSSTDRMNCPGFQAGVSDPIEQKATHL